MAEHKFKIILKIDNIGPHYADNSINFSIDVNSNKAVFYAANGTGKTFISRSFRAIEINSSNLDDVLTLGKESGEFFLSVDNKSVSLQIHRGDKPVIADSLNRLFHVFNHDFVEENIIPRHYSPNGEIEGYILGKEQIDLTNERNRERELKDCIETLNTQLDDRITEARRKLSTAGVTSNTTEMKLITTDAFKNGMAYTDIDTYDNILSRLDLLSKIPDDMRDIAVPSWNNIESQFDELGELLNTSFPDNNQDQEFVKFMRDNNSFIKDGLSIYETDPQACPFCKRPVDNEVLNIIQKYKKFCADQASKTISKLKKYSSDLDALCNRINNYNIEIAKATMALEQFKKYLPSLKDYSLSRIDTDGLVQELIDKIKYSISTKIDDLSLSISESHEFMELLSNFIKTATKIYEINRDLIVAANRTKNNTNADRLALRRNLCKAMYNQSKPEVSQILSRINEKQNELKSLQSDISEKENKIKISKREKVYNTLICLLDMFFSGKYSLDKDSFQIQFQGNNIGENASKILSEGEKSIVAYCYYLATTHLLISNESDYERLFFVIDDPISSMDFQYVYILAQTIRYIGIEFDIKQHERIWILTHNIEFFSLLKRNFIINNAFTIRPGKISKLDPNLLLPYESHLMDILKIAQGKMSPSHTTGNSIRHILETLSRFEYPERKLEEYILENEVLQKDPIIYTICQDLSHGAIRRQSPYTEDALIEACKSVIAFMESKYPGQIKALKQNDS